MIITFLGHKNIVEQNALYEKVQEAILQNILADDKIYFYCGGYGDFDNICASVCHSIKNKVKNCEIIFITPYLTEAKQRKIKAVDNLKIYDSTIYPPIENTPPRYAIIKRNEWMIDQADIIIAYVNHEFGGAFTALQYATKRKKTILNLAK